MKPGRKILAAEIGFESEYEAFLHSRGVNVMSNRFVLNTSASPNYWTRKPLD